MAKTMAASLESYHGLDERVMTTDAATPAENGAVLGGLLGCAVGLGASPMGITMPGAGPIVAASPMVMALTGTVVGALAGGLIGTLTDQSLSRWRDGGRTGWSASALPNTPDEAERERRQYGVHADPLTGLPLTADPELDNVLGTTIRR
jgi:hypothetical protein